VSSPTREVCIDGPPEVPVSDPGRERFDVSLGGSATVTRVPENESHRRKALACRPEFDELERATADLRSTSCQDARVGGDPRSSPMGEVPAAWASRFQF
jgi:hypothetical protein